MPLSSRAPRFHELLVVPGADTRHITCAYSTESKDAIDEEMVCVSTRRRLVYEDMITGITISSQLPMATSHKV